MRLEPDYQVEVTGRCPPGSLPALAGQPDPLTVGDAGRNGDLQAARAIRAGNLDPAMHALVGLLNGQLQPELLIGPGDGAPVAPAAPPEHATEEVLDVDALHRPLRAEVEPHALLPRRLPTGAWSARPRSRPGPGPGLRIYPLRHLPEVVPERVIAASQLRIGQHVIRLGDLLEALLRIGRLVDVRMVGARQLPVRPLDLLRRGVTGHAERLVEIATISHRWSRRRPRLQRDAAATRRCRSPAGRPPPRCPLERRRGLRPWLRVAPDRMGARRR